MDEWDDHDLARFCKARQFKLADAKTMFATMIQWRKEHQVDTLLFSFDFPEYHPMHATFPHGFHKTDKIGRPVYYQRLGIMNVPLFCSLSTNERFLGYYMQSYEVLMRLVFPACSAEAGR